MKFLIGWSLAILFSGVFCLAGWKFGELIPGLGGLRSPTLSVSVGLVSAFILGISLGLNK